MSTVADLWTLFARSADAAPHQAALEVDGRVWSYAELNALARRTAYALTGAGAKPGSPVGLWATRDASTYAALLGILHAGCAYVPMHPGWPAERLRHIARCTGFAQVVVPPHLDPSRDALLEAAAPNTKRIPVPFDATGSIPDTAPHRGDPAYILFTSGSTGVPKGVAVSHANVLAYVAHAASLIDARSTDRFSQTFELTFDLSVHDLFVCWAAGATLVVPTRDDLLRPAQYIRAQRITQWFAVPSLAVLIHRQRSLKDGAFPSLRCSAFCGEPLAETIARSWSASCAGGRVINLYGPTETTIAITAYELPQGDARSHHGVLAIGRPFPHATIAVVDAEDHEAEEGELLLRGPQVAMGYWNDPERTAASFVQRAGDGPWYRTGDRVRRGADGDLLFLGRMDQQVKVRGYRIELEEVDQALRTTSGAAFAHTIAHPVVDGVATGLVAFLPAPATIPAEDLRARLGRLLPDHMVPARFLFIDKVPTTTSGKVDLQALAMRAAQGPSDGAR
ncbi:MAG: amino acid adenylation domain-containing protein [Flavobacteriales bacterium]|nr:amino acid adenylation domain-containing protein [Flavobacteriales bacterium]